MTQYQGSPNQRWGHISYAQHGDDFMLVNLFEMLGIDKPSYLDLGAHQPTDISNTRLLYERGSRGVNVEANPRLIELFRCERPEDLNVNIGVGLLDGTALFYMYGDEDGRNTFSKEEIRRTGMRVANEVFLPIKTVNQIVKDYCGDRWPDLLSCDIEGLDFDVLSSADFDVPAPPKVICVETRTSDSKCMRDMLHKKDYRQYCRMGENLFFVRDDLVWLVEP